MSINSLLADSLRGNLGLLQKHLADFSDADFFARPTPKANHSAWQIGHMAFFEVMVANVLSPGKLPACPADWKELFGKKGSTIDEASAFPPPRKLLETLAAAHNAIADYAASAPAGDFDKPAPEDFRSFCATLGDLILLMPQHVCMHLGQFQVIRRALGKPNIF